jgi:hypothetical protein
VDSPELLGKKTQLSTNFGKKPFAPSVSIYDRGGIEEERKRTFDKSLPPQEKKNNDTNTDLGVE